MCRTQGQLAVLGSNETVFHHVCDADCRLDADNSSRSLDGVSCPHHFVDVAGVAGVPFQCQQSGGQRFHVGLDFCSEDLHHRGVGKYFAVHDQP